MLVAVGFASCDVNRNDYVGEWTGVARDSTAITMTLNDDGSFVEKLVTIDNDKLEVTCVMKGQWSINGKDIEGLIDPESVNLTASDAAKNQDVAQLQARMKEELVKRHQDGTKAKFLASTNILPDNTDQKKDTLCGTFPTQGSVQLIRIK